MMRSNLAIIILAWVAICAFIIPHAEAAVNPNFTPVFDTADEVHVNWSSHLDTSTATPIEMWVFMAVAGLLLFLYSLPPKSSSAEIEHSILISAIAWLPIGFTAYTAWAVERITSFGVTGLVESQAANGAVQTHEYVLLENHIIYHFDFWGVAYGVFLVVAIVNTVRLYALRGSKVAEEAQAKQVGNQ